MLNPHSQNSDIVPLNQPSGPHNKPKFKHFLLDTQNNTIKCEHEHYMGPLNIFFPNYNL